MQVHHYPPRDAVVAYSVRDQKFLQIGRHSYMVEYSEVVQYKILADITIGNFCSIAAGCRFMARQDHVPGWVTTYPIGAFLGNHAAEGRFDQMPSRIVIGNDVWVGYGATILPGVTIGDGAIIGTNALVTKDVPPYGVVLGIPGQVVKLRFPDHIVEKLLKIAWWHWDDARIRQHAHLIWSDEIEKFTDMVEQA